MTEDPGSLPPTEIIALTAPLEAALLSFTATIQQAGLMQASKWIHIALCDLEQAIKEMSPVWSGRKHSRLLAAKYHTAADFLRSQGRTVNQNDAGSLTARTARYLERNRIAGDGIDDRNLVVELLRRKRIVRYFPSWALEAVDQFGWSAKTSVIADAQAELAYLEGPLKPPPPPKPPKRTNKTTRATAKEGKQKP